MATNEHRGRSRLGVEGAPSYSQVDGQAGGLTRTGTDSGGQNTQVISGLRIVANCGERFSPA
jgi:hypothetical protein